MDLPKGWQTSATMFFGSLFQSYGTSYSQQRKEMKPYDCEVFVWGQDVGAGARKDENF